MKRTLIDQPRDFRNSIEAKRLDNLAKLSNSRRIRQNTLDEQNKATKSRQHRYDKQLETITRTLEEWQKAAEVAQGGHTVSRESTINRFKSDAYEPKIRAMPPLEGDDIEVTNAETSSYHSDESLCEADGAQGRGQSVPTELALQYRRSIMINRNANFEMSPEVL